MSIRGLAALAAVATTAAVILAGCVPVELDPDEDGAAVGPGEVPLQVMEQDGQALAFVPVTIDGEGPYLFALDTGASVTTIDLDIVEDLGLPATGETRQVTGVIGAQEVEIVQVDQWQLGDLELAPAEVAVIDLPSPPTGEGLQGLLGSDVLSGFGEVVIDYDNQVLRIPGEEDEQ